MGEEHHTGGTSRIPSLLVVVSQIHQCLHHHHILVINILILRITIIIAFTAYSGIYTAPPLKEERLAITAVRPKHSMTM